MESIEIQPVVLCGGAGTRLWPLSRTGFPKQFLCFDSSDSLFQKTVGRVARQTDVPGLSVGAPYVVCNEAHRFLAQEQLREMGMESATYLLEPDGRNTAPALAMAALMAASLGRDPVLVVLPADQLIQDEATFRDALSAATRIAADDEIAILGIQPDRPETGYGYIKLVDAQVGGLVECFVEKPDAATAQAYVEQGGYYWNAGMFVLKASVWLKSLENCRPDIMNAMRAAWEEKSHDGAFVRPDAELFKAIPSESIDYAVMERGADSGFALRMVPLDAGWSDLGSWDSVWGALAKDEDGNAAFGDVLSIDSGNMLVHATHRLVATMGVSNLVVVETADAVLVADQSRCQDVKRIVAELNDKGREEPVLHRKVYRPWGWYDSVDEGGRFKVKRILVKPKASLSLQRHHHRSEHWIVVKGTAEVTNGEAVTLLTENQSTYIPLGAVHRLSNPGSIPLEIIEVQLGSYLGEDDIQRFEDDYGRGG